MEAAVDTNKPSPAQDSAALPAMSLEAARRVRWQIAPYEFMGVLWDAGQLTRAQCEWAVRKYNGPENSDS